MHIIRERRVQGAVKLVIEPIFETDFHEFSYDFQEGRSTYDARKEIYSCKFSVLSYSINSNLYPSIGILETR